MERHNVVLESSKFQSIYLVLDDGREIDLHNFADFETLEISCSRIEMRWTVREPRKEGRAWWKPLYDTRDVLRVCWVFENTQVIERKERDSEMPLTEDSCLSGYGVSPDFSRFYFQWQSGADLEFSAGSCYAQIEAE